MLQTLCFCSYCLIFIFSENPCPITFETPPVVKESGRITLTCSTLSSCPSNPQIQDLYSQQTHEEQKSTKASFTANWQDNGKEFSCQTENNTDKYLIRNVSITVECKFMNWDFIYALSTKTVGICTTDINFPNVN